jgi:hypothetical protein
MKANEIDGTDIIHVPAGVYTLTIPPSGDGGDDGGDLNITASVAITGAGAGRTIVDGNASDRVFDVSAGQFVGLTGLTIRNGDQRGNGAGIRNAGILTIDHCTIRPVSVCMRLYRQREFPARTGDNSEKQDHSESCPAGCTTGPGGPRPLGIPRRRHLPRRHRCRPRR